ncbi:MAG: fumarylacetoacetate hydrolase family protein [Alphaproteobacteria bacterium]
MKLCSFLPKAGPSQLEPSGLHTPLAPRPGVIFDDGIADLQALEQVAERTLMALLAAGPDALESLAVLGGIAPRLDPDTVRLTAPIPRPGKLLGIGLNYLDHVRETGREPPAHQIWFNKQTTCVIGPNDPIRIPPVSDMVDYEGELAVVIGRRCRRVPAARAREVIAGYMVGNDVSVRDWQRRTPTMILGKSFDSHGPQGPWMVTADDIPDPQALRIRTWVNDDLRQDASTAEMIFSIAEQIETLSTVCTLEPGDVIFTGTPAGVGMAMDPPGFVKAGDTVRIEISGIGTLSNPVTADADDVLIE